MFVDKVEQFVLHLQKSLAKVSIESFDHFHDSYIF